MRPLYEEKARCFGCGACEAACPAGAVSMARDGEGFPYPVLNAALCRNCGACETVCPAKHPLDRAEGRFYALRCKDGALLDRSTSGGAFSLLAGEVLDRGGLVCGACFDGGFTVRHVLSRDIAPMRKSKYVQSDLSGCYGAVREALDGGRQVFFTGTPCQCHALERYLGGRREGLVLAALVCWGVQPPGLWEAYVSWLGRDGALEAYDFRDNRRRDDGHTVSWTLSGRPFSRPMGEDPFSRLYNRRLVHRPSCYRCPYRSPEAGFDFTLGDFWGIERIRPELADGRGTSLVIARGDGARSLVEGLSAKALVLPCRREEALQSALTASQPEPRLRRALFRDFAREQRRGRSPFPLLLKRYGGNIPWALRKMRAVWRRIKGIWNQS